MFLKRGLSIWSVVSDHHRYISVCEFGFEFAGGGRGVETEATENVHTALETDIVHRATGAHIVVRGTGTAK
jgi:hypothetical protein